MSVGRVVRGALVGALAFACGERAGDPVIALPASSPVSGAGAAGSPETGAGGQAGDPNPAQAGRGPSGLCAACDSSGECGDANDACIRHQDQRFCGRDCDEQSDCPDGYACVELDNSQLWQCVPLDGCAMPPPPAPTLAELQQYVRARVNAERAERGRAPLHASSCLDDLAHASALEFARTDEPLGKFVKECDPIWPNCACGWSAEAELTVARYGLDWATAVEHALGSYRDTANDRFVQAFLSTEVTDVGIGFWLSGDEAWLALSFR
jgi:hypothetical protein